ncbi:MAG: hypothetical protein COX43_03010 [Parcubacteria group bacterium CG23_combo_of_CG06-09_8_20_14_all_35_9]|nr:MAG: hypothetical protein COX43_03010 [Parcubacteria group bacterium CG23_combo_of_CG06-09_8_20_14_all_35_9]
MEDKHWKNYISNIEPRVNKLINAGFYYETVFLFSNILEAELTHLIKEYQRSCKHILNNEKIKFYPSKWVNTEKLTLGMLRKYISVFIKDKKILNKIDKFNNLRKKTIHKLLDQQLIGLKKEILEKEISGFVSEFYKLMEELIDKRIAIMKNLNKYKEKALIYEYKIKRKKRK